MSTLLEDDLDMETQIRRKNLRTAWRGRWTWSVADRTRLELLRMEEWGAQWREEVEAHVQS